MADRKELEQVIYILARDWEYSRRFQEPTGTCSHEYGNEVAWHEAGLFGEEIVSDLEQTPLWALEIIAEYGFRA